MNLLIFFCSIIFFDCVKRPAMFNESMAELQRNSAFRKLDAQTTDSSSLDLFNIGYAN